MKPIYSEVSKTIIHYYITKFLNVNGFNGKESASKGDEHLSGNVIPPGQGHSPPQQVGESRICSNPNN